MQDKTHASPPIASGKQAVKPKKEWHGNVEKMQNRAEKTILKGVTKVIGARAFCHSVLED